MLGVLRAAVARGTVAGGVGLVANREGVLEVASFGHSDLGHMAAGRWQSWSPIAMQPDSLFWVAPLSKPLTGAAAMMLVDEGA